LTNINLWRGRAVGAPQQLAAQRAGRDGCASGESAARPADAILLRAR
jgi:hypothetical protein